MTTQAQKELALKRLAEIRALVRKRGRIYLRCPFCRHYLVGITSPRGDFKLKTGGYSELYCSWPDCCHYSDRVRVVDAVRGRGPKDGSHCCNRGKGQGVKAKS